MTSGKEYVRDKRSPLPKSETISRVMSAIKGKSTKPELLLRKALFSEGIRGYRLNYKKLPGKPDIVFPKKKVVILIQGCFWHGCIVCGRRTPKHNSEYWVNKINTNVERDLSQKQKLESLGYKIIEIWEHEFKTDFDLKINQILEICK